MEEPIDIEFLKHNKIWIFPSRIEDQAFVFVRKKTEFLTAKDWDSWLPVTQKLRRTAYKKFKFSCVLRIIQKRFFHQATFTFF